MSKVTVVLTESSEGTPCITGLLEQMDEINKLPFKVTINLCSPEDSEPRLCNVTMECDEIQPLDLVDSVVSQYAAKGSDITYEVVEDNR